jgi:hypothetical protein
VPLQKAVLLQQQEQQPLLRLASQQQRHPQEEALLLLALRLLLGVLGVLLAVAEAAWQLWPALMQRHQQQVAASLLVLLLPAPQVQLLLQLQAVHPQVEGTCIPASHLLPGQSHPRHLLLHQQHLLLLQALP